MLLDKIKFSLPVDKHIGIILDPRSGSHAFRNYVSSSLDILNMGEFLNPMIHSLNLLVDKNKKFVYTVPDQRYGRPLQLVNETLIDQWIDEKIKILDEMSSIDQFGIFSIVLKNTLSYFPDVIKKIKNNSNIHFIRLKRIDVLYGIISIEICKHTDIWHNVDHTNTFSRENIKDKINIPLDVINKHLEMYIKCESLVEEIFGKVPILYYEQWQNNIRNLNKILNLPNKLVSIDYQKFTGNYKNLILNIDEIEDHYEEFVNKHPEHFPQYFDKLTDIIIPESQGRQPRNLLSTFVHEFN